MYLRSLEWDLASYTFITSWPTQCAIGIARDHPINIYHRRGGEE